MARRPWPDGRRAARAHRGSRGLRRALPRRALCAAIRDRGAFDGWAVAQQFALAWPDRVEGLVLVGTGARLVLPRLLDLVASDYQEGVKLLMQLAVATEVPARLKTTLHRPNGRPTLSASSSAISRPATCST
jgi:hypothetical protein